MSSTCIYVSTKIICSIVYWCFILCSAISARGFQDDVRPGETELSRQIRQWDEANAMFYGPERDLKNFPTEKQKVQPAPVKLGFIPQTWFDAFYEKTGVTGELLKLFWA